MVAATRAYVPVITNFLGKRSAIQPTSSLPAMLDHWIRTDAVLQRGIEHGLIDEAVVLEDQLHVLVDGADRSDGAEAADHQQPERPRLQHGSHALRRSHGNG